MTVTISNLFLRITINQSTCLLSFHIFPEFTDVAINIGLVSNVILSNMKRMIFEKI